MRLSGPEYLEPDMWKGSFNSQGIPYSGTKGIVRPGLLTNANELMSSTRSLRYTELTHTVSGACGYYETIHGRRTLCCGRYLEGKGCGLSTDRKEVNYITDIACRFTIDILR